MPQLFASIRGLSDASIITTRTSVREFARYAHTARGLRVSSPIPGTAQEDNYLFGGMPFVLLVFLQILQACYSFIIGQLAIPQWINPLQPSDPPDAFSVAFVLKFGGQQSYTTVFIVFATAFVVLFPFIGVYIMHSLCSLIEETRELSVWQLDHFVPQYLAEKFIPIKSMRPQKRAEWETTSLIPRVSPQMPGPATNSRVLSTACHPRPEEAGMGMAYKRLKWGVVREPGSFQSTDIGPPKSAGPQELERDTIRSIAGKPWQAVHTPFDTADRAAPANDALGPLYSYPANTARRFSVARKAISGAGGDSHASAGIQSRGSVLYRPISTDYDLGDGPGDPHDYGGAILPGMVPWSNPAADTTTGANRPWDAEPQPTSPHSPDALLQRSIPATAVRDYGSSPPVRTRDSVTIQITPLTPHPPGAGRSVSELSTVSAAEKGSGAPSDACGHCTFSVHPVAELRPGWPYTGLRWDDQPFGARARGVLLVTGFVRALELERLGCWVIARFFPRRRGRFVDV